MRATRLKKEAAKPRKQTTEEMQRALMSKLDAALNGQNEIASALETIRIDLALVAGCLADVLEAHGVRTDAFDLARRPTEPADAPEPETVRPYGPLPDPVPGALDGWLPGATEQGDRFVVEEEQGHKEADLEHDSADLGRLLLGQAVQHEPDNADDERQHDNHGGIIDRPGFSDQSHAAAIALEIASTPAPSA